MQIHYGPGQTVRSNVQGERTLGDDVLPLSGHHDLTEATSWAEAGYHVAPWLDKEHDRTFEQGVRRLFQRFLQRVGVTVDRGMNLEHYHRYIRHDDALHLAVVEQAKWLDTGDFPGGARAAERRVSELCGVPVRAVNPHNGERAFHFRIVRPQRPDHNPFHRDVWLPEYHDAINIYVPLAGSNERSSLTLVPGSHRWSEATVERTRGGALVDGVQYNVPAVTASQPPLRPIRPNPACSEVLIFSPYLLHGGAVNLNEDLTRISLEMRFWAG